MIFVIKGWNLSDPTQTSQREIKSHRDAEPSSGDVFQSSKILTISGGHAVHDAYTAFLPAMLPAFISNLSLSLTEAGMLTVFLSFPSLLQPLIGNLADRLSLRYLFIFAPAISAVVMSVLGVANSFIFLALLLLMAGLSSSALHAIGPVMAGRLSGQGLGKGMGFWMVGGELGRTIGPIVIVSAIQLVTLRGTPWLMIPGIAFSGLLLILLRDVSGRPTNEIPVLPWRTALVGMRKLLFPLTGIIFVRLFMTAALTTYMPTYLTQQGAGLWLAGASLSLLEAAGVVGAFLGGTISDRIGRQKLIRLSMTTAPVLMIAFVFSAGWLQVLLLPLLGFVSLATPPVIMALVQESFPENRALANGLYMAMGFVLRFIVILILGGIGDWIGLRVGFLVSAMLMLICLPLVGRIPRRALPTRV